MTSTLDASSTTETINFADRVSRRRGGLNYDYDENHFSIWSCKFSADGNEVIAGGTEMVFGTSPIPYIRDPLLTVNSVRPCERQTYRQD